MTRCPACSQVIADGLSPCPSCGSAIEELFVRTRLFADSPPKAEVHLPHPPGSNKPAVARFTSLDDEHFVAGTILSGRYRIIGLLGKGGMGEVYHADDLKLGQPVALKFLPQDLLSNSDALVRFHREVRIARQVSHQHVCRVYDITEVDGHQFLSMEYIKGEELSSLLRRIGRLPADKAIEIARQLCAGLAAAHKKGVLHRDLKPSNVMIDDAGNVRITDFGLAALEEEIRTEEIRSGTPAYMSPEQLAGTELTVKSDIYSLGLVLYELFTGRKAFDAPTIGQLLDMRNSDTTPTTPSSLVQNIDPLVERVILRCIEKDPQRRPDSALQVAASLPGGDPLAAALAAGETPSPEMVAATPKEGVLRPGIALACLSAILLGLVLIIWLSGKADLHRLVPLEKSPEALKERARAIVQRLGYTDPPADNTYGLGTDRAYFTYVLDHDSSPSRWSTLSSGQPAALFYWYRQSPRYLTPMDHAAERASPEDPSTTVSGMVNVNLDTMGRLIRFEAVPPQLDPISSNQINSPTLTRNSESEPRNATLGTALWSPLFEEAGLSIASFTQTQSKWLPPSSSDRRAAWEGTISDNPQIPIRVEAAAYNGKLTYFEIVSPWTRADRMQQIQLRGGLKILVVVFLVLIISFIVTGVLLARKNLLKGRGDRKGAFRLASFCFAAQMISWMFLAHHYPAFDEFFDLFVPAVMKRLFAAALLWLFYIALEPYVRRWWPQRIVSWSRLLAGEFRDPLVGRDILIGAVFGVTLQFGFYVGDLARGSVGVNATIEPTLSALLGLRESVGQVLDNAGTVSVLIGLFYLFLLFLLYVLCRRREWLSSLVAWLLPTIVLGISSRNHLIGMLLGGVSIALILIVITKFGLLAMIASQFVVQILLISPMTSDFSTWYAGSTIFGLCTVIAFVLYGFYISLGGLPVFKGRILRE